jgi:hypothetical protein
MAMNMGALLHAKERMQIFNEQHKRVLPFLRDVGANAIMPGSIVEMTVTRPDGKRYVTNIRVTEEDVETMRILGEQR